MPQVNISPALYNEFKSFANETGLTLEKSIHNALNGWMDLQGLCILDTLDQRKAEAAVKAQKQTPARKRGRVISFPESQAV
jgi:hypothetical protein